MDTYQFNATEFSLLERSCIPLAIYQFINKRVVTVALSEGFCELFGYDRSEAYRLMDHDMYRDTHPDDISRIADAAFRFATEDGPYDVIYRTKSSNGYIIIHAYGRHVYASDGTRLAVIWYNDEGSYTPDPSTQSGKLNPALNAALHEETLYQRNYYDYLTGLPTMTYFFELADEGRTRMLEDGDTPAMLFIDLNGMMFFNRTHGFAEGDRLIRSVAKVLVRHFSNENCSRFGQDHFAVFTKTAGLEKKLYAIFDECKELGNGKNLPLRVGIYSRIGEKIDVATACDRAKFACDLSRHSPTSTFRYFDKALLSKVENEQYIVQHLDNALEGGWIKVYYQPIVRTANGQVCDEEALARWIDPHKGFLSPAEFIPALENAKLIYKLDLYVLEQVLKKVQRQQRAGLYVVPQSINLSRADFDMCDIVDEICQRVDAAGIDRSLLTIEVTESMVGDDVEFMKQQIQRFQDLGFEVWMDDFGSGYSSLDLLQSVHFDLIKLDMSFMRRFEKGDESKIILTELVKMAIGLGIDTLSEGVETEEQVDFLRDIGCSKIQGFYYCKPIPFEQIVERYQAGIQIGYENPDETDYYAAIGKINLYDLAVITHDNQDTLRHYFNTIPMAIYELFDDGIRISRCNASYRDFLRRVFGITSVKDDFITARSDELPSETNSVRAKFTDALRHCARDGNTIVFDDELRDGETTHVILKHIAANPITGTVALALAVLAVVRERGQTPPRLVCAYRQGALL